MPTRRSGPGVVEVNGRVYALGGESAQGASMLVEEYDPATNGWAERTPLPESRRHMGVAAIGGRIFVMGGETRRMDTDLNQELQLLTAYYPYRKTWEAP